VNLAEGSINTISRRGRLRSDLRVPIYVFRFTRSDLRGLIYVLRFTRLLGFEQIRRVFGDAWWRDYFGRR
jgi:hypothetical protein